MSYKWEADEPPQHAEAFRPDACIGTYRDAEGVLRACRRDGGRNRLCRSCEKGNRNAGVSTGDAADTRVSGR